MDYPFEFDARSGGSGAQQTHDFFRGHEGFQDQRCGLILTSGASKYLAGHIREAGDPDAESVTGKPEGNCAARFTMLVSRRQE